MPKPVLTADPHASFAATRAELISAFASVLDGGRYILGEQVEAFEREWAAYCQTGHAVGLSSGTDALALALRAIGVIPGDEVLVPAMTAVATWMAVSQIGAVPIGVDIERRRNGMDPALARAATTPRTRAIVAVHLFGQPADVDGLREVALDAGVPLVEDAAQAHGASEGGASVGSLGSIAAFSFYPTKNLGAIGDAGAITTQDPVLAERVRALREYGWRTRADAEIKGINARIDELQAALLRVMLPRLKDSTSRRRTIARAYLEGLAGIEELELPCAASSAEHVWHLFVVRHPRRAALAEALGNAGIRTGVHYETLPALNSAFAADGWRKGMFPVSEHHAATALSLPMHPGLDDSEVDLVIEAMRTIASEI
jgi:dTDP-4-amino-4,6-dideoxygalactose transaminase